MGLVTWVARGLGCVCVVNNGAACTVLHLKGLSASFSAVLHLKGSSASFSAHTTMDWTGHSSQPLSHLVSIGRRFTDVSFVTTVPLLHDILNKHIQPYGLLVQSAVEPWLIESASNRLLASLQQMLPTHLGCFPSRPRRCVVSKTQLGRGFGPSGP